MPKPDGRGKAIKHGHYAEGYEFAIEYRIWRAMHKRCTDSKHPHYKNYGGRGITICEQWQSFDVFLSDLGKRPTRLHTLERLNNDLGYSPDNCCWATRRQQANNRRSNKVFMHSGKAQTLKEWTDELGLDYKNVWQRIYVLEWPFERAIT